MKTPAEQIRDERIIAENKVRDALCEFMNATGAKPVSIEFNVCDVTIMLMVSGESRWIMGTLKIEVGL